MFTPTTAAPPAPKTADETKDLGKEETEAAVAPQTVVACPVPPSMSEEEFKKQHPQVETTITLAMGTSVTCFVVGGKVFIQSAAKVLLPGVMSENSKPIFMYAGGSWISESAKAPRVKFSLFVQTQSQDYICF